MTIAEVSKKYDITPDTLRYYERVGLLTNVSRNPNGIRNYDEQSCKRIEFVKCMRNAGVEIEILIEYMNLFEQGKSKFSFDGEDYGDLTGKYLLEKMKKDPKVVAIVAGVPTNIGFTKDRRIEAGDQFVDVGIAEEHAVALASGIAKNGGKPIFATYSSFIQRTYDQISQDLCINNNPATILVNGASVFGMNDVTHLGLYDIPMISNIPNIVHLAPT